MIIRLPTVFAFILIMLITGIVQNFKSWSWPSFMYGFVVMAPLLTVWLSNKAAGTLLSLLGVGGLLLISFGGIDSLNVNRVFFLGASCGFILGIIPAYLIKKDKVLEYVLHIAEMENYPKLELFARKKLNRKR